MRMSEAFPSKYLRAADLHQRSVSAKISVVQMEDVGGGDHKPVVYFHGKEKGLVLNKTNGMMIAYAFGDDTESWSGAEVELYPTVTSFQGKPVDAIRVRVTSNGRGGFAAPQPAPTPPAAPPQGQYDERNPPPFDDDIPF